METNQRTTKILWIAIAVLVAVAGALWYAQTGLKNEMAQLSDAQRTLATERDGLLSETQSQRDRIGLLDTETADLKSGRDAQAAEAQRLDASLAESQTGLEGAQAEVKNLKQAQQETQQKLQALNAEKDVQSTRLAQLQEQAQAMTTASDNLTQELASSKSALADAQARAAQRDTAFEQLQTLNAEKDAQLTQLAQLQEQVKAMGTTNARLSQELGTTSKALTDTQARIAQRNTAFEQLQKQHTQLVSTDTSRQAEVKTLQQAQQDAQKKLQSLNTEKQAVAQKLTGVQDQAKTAAAASDKLRGELGAAKQSLAAAMAREAEQQAVLKKSQQTGQEAQKQLLSLSNEKDAVARQLTGVQEQVKAAATAAEKNERDLSVTKTSLADALTRVTQRDATLEQLQKKNAQVEAADAAKQVELARMQQLQQQAQQNLQALGTEKADITQKLVGAQDQAKAATAAGANLSAELGSTKQTLTEARARAAELNKSYEVLIKDHSKLAQTNVARREELAQARTAFEDAQNEVARLTGARGIYTVQSADSLSSIAAYFYRQGARWSDIHKANAFLAENPDLIYAGQVLIIPK